MTTVFSSGLLISHLALDELVPIVVGERSAMKSVELRLNSADVLNFD